MGYSTDILHDLITIQNRIQAATNKFGLDAGGIGWENTCQDMAEVTWAKGKQALNAGAMDAYAAILVRMRWNSSINMRSRIVYDGQVYSIIPETFHHNYIDNTIQFNAQLIINDKNYDPEPEPEPEPDPKPEPEPEPETPTQESTQETGAETEPGADAPGAASNE